MRPLNVDLSLCLSKDYRKITKNKICHPMKNDDWKRHKRVGVADKNNKIIHESKCWINDYVPKYWYCVIWSSILPFVVSKQLGGLLIDNKYKQYVSECSTTEYYYLYYSQDIEDILRYKVNFSAFKIEYSHQLMLLKSKVSITWIVISEH